MANLETFSSISTSESIEQVITQRYRSGIYLELQKYKNVANNCGINYTVSELRALSAITVLLSKIRYSNSILTFSLITYLEAYYGIRTDSKQYKGQQVRLAKDALIALCNKPVKIAYFMRDRKTWFRDEGFLVKKLKETSGANNLKEEITLECHSIFFDNIDSFYTLKPLNLYKEAREFSGCNRVKKAVILFLEWLLTQERPIIPIFNETLLERLWLENMVRDRHNKRAKEIIEECCETSKGLGYLTGYKRSRDKSNKLFLELNPERCSRVNSNKKYSKGHLKITTHPLFTKV